MATEQEKQAELDRVTEISGFQFGIHRLMADMDLEVLKDRNDRWEKVHGGQSLVDRKNEELMRMAVYIAARATPEHISIHIHSAHEAGATSEEIMEVINRTGSWIGAVAKGAGLEAWRQIFLPNTPPINRVVALTSDSFER